MNKTRTVAVIAANAMLFLPFILIWNGFTHPMNPVKFHVDTAIPVNQLVGAGLLAALAVYPAMQVFSLRDELYFQPERRLVVKHAIYGVLLGLLAAAIAFSLAATLLTYPPSMGAFIFAGSIPAGLGFVYGTTRPRTVAVKDDEEWIPEDESISLTTSTGEAMAKQTIPSFLEFIEDPGKTFEDIIGLNDAKNELSISIDLMENPDRAIKFGVKPLKGVLLHGPPGTGKTLFAKAAAGTYGKKFIRVITSELIHHHIGQTEKNIRETFEFARANAPCILFIDEIETLAGNRKDAQNSWERSHVNALLQELDGIQGGDNAPIVLAATNHKDAMDSAVLRDGRLERHIEVGLPDEDNRHDLFKLFTRNKNIDAKVDMRMLAQRTEGVSPAAIEGMCNDVARAIYLESFELGISDPRPATLVDFLKVIQRRQ